MNYIMFPTHWPMWYYTLLLHISLMAMHPRCMQLQASWCLTAINGCVSWCASGCVASSLCHCILSHQVDKQVHLIINSLDFLFVYWARLVIGPGASWLSKVVFMQAIGVLLKAPGASVAPYLSVWCWCSSLMFAKPSMHSQHHHSADGVRRSSPI